MRIPVPATRERPGRTLSPCRIDRWTAETPFEERRVVDEGLFASFGDRAAEMLRPWGFAPLSPAFWMSVRRHVAANGLIGEAFTAARRELERSWGCHNLEVPLSAVCGSETFACFAGRC